jgi:hypothetical protein
VVGQVDNRYEKTRLDEGVGHRTHSLKRYVFFNNCLHLVSVLTILIQETITVASKCDGGMANSEAHTAPLSSDYRGCRFAFDCGLHVRGGDLIGTDPHECHFKTFLNHC